MLKNIPFFIVITGNFLGKKTKVLDEMVKDNRDGNNPLVGVVLAAGKGTRMKSTLPKVLHPLLGRPMLSYVLDLLTNLDVARKVVVVGHKAESVKKEFDDSQVDFVLQAEQLGTGHAVKQTQDVLSDVKADILIICGDTPVFTLETLKKFVSEHRKNRSRLSILSSFFENPRGYGRIVRNSSQEFLMDKIVEERDATFEERQIKEINTGTYLVDAEMLFKLLDKLDDNNDQGEYYLTDIVSHAVAQGELVYAFPFASEEEALGVNSRADLSKAESILLKRLRLHWMAQGVTFEMANTTYLEPTVKLGKDVVVRPHVVMKGDVEVGDNAVIGSFSYLRDVSVEEGANIAPFSNLQPN